MELRWPTDRIDYVPITERQPLPLPDGAKLIVWPCVNVEHWVISEPMPRTVVSRRVTSSIGWPVARRRAPAHAATDAGRRSGSSPRPARTRIVRAAFAAEACRLSGEPSPA